MMQQSELAPAGWYPDPLGTPHVRWWDSYSWTEHTQALQEASRASETFVVSSHLGWADPEDSKPDEPSFADVRAQLARIAPPKIHSSPANVAPPATVTPPVTPAPPVTVAPPATSPIGTPAPIPAANSVNSAATSPAPGLSAPHAFDTANSSHASTPNHGATENAGANRPGSTYLETPNGWLAVNFAINTAWENSIIRVISHETPDVTIDCERGLYWCEVELDALPRKVRELTVRMQTKQQTSAPTHAGRELQGLLWMLGVEIDFGKPITDVDPNNRFKLRGWPNTTTIRQSDLQVQMTSMLGNAFLTPAELAAVTDSNTFDATRLIAAYKIMGLIVEVPDVASPNADTDLLGAAPESLARRLWSTLKK